MDKDKEQTKILPPDYHQRREVFKITNKREYMTALKYARYLCYRAHERTAWEEDYYHRLTTLIVEYARIT